MSCEHCEGNWRHLYAAYLWVSRFKYKIKVAPCRFELGATPFLTHVGGHLDQLWNSNKSYLMYGCSMASAALVGATVVGAAAVGPVVFGAA